MKMNYKDLKGIARVICILKEGHYELDVQEDKVIISRGTGRYKMVVYRNGRICRKSKNKETEIIAIESNDKYYDRIQILNSGERVVVHNLVYVVFNQDMWDDILDNYNDNNIYVIHHSDYNRYNNNIDNLVLFLNNDHIKFHKEQRRCLR